LLGLTYKKVTPPQVLHSELNMDPIHLMIIYTGILIFVGYLYFCADPSGSGPLSILARFGFESLPAFFWKATEKIIGKRGKDRLAGIFDYVINQRNPLLQIFYLVLMSGGYMCIVLFAYPRVPNHVLGTEHRVYGGIVMATCLVSWFVACRVEPGILTKRNLQMYDNYELDDILYEGQDCRTCKFKKIARSKHCAVCNMCISRFDHHCAWINQCVGEKNYRFFLAFLLIHAISLLYGGLMMGLLLFDTVLDKRLMDVRYMNKITGKVEDASYMMVSKYLMFYDGTICALMAICVVMGVVLLGFFFYHLSLVRRNVTTNENFKWHQYTRAYRYALREHEEKLAAEKSKKGENGDLKTRVQMPPFPSNIYRRSLFQNVMEVLHPRCYRKRIGTPRASPKTTKKQKAH